MMITYLGYSQEKSTTFYATMETKDAKALKKNHPSEIEIIATNGESTAVLLTQEGAEELHHKVLVHGPGFIYEPTKESALATIKSTLRLQSKNRAVNYTIDQDQLVNQSLNLVNNVNIANQIQELENYGTRYHTTNSARQAILDLKTKWETMAAGRSDVSVRIVNHTSTNMPSVVMTITGTESPDQYVIIGGHADSTASGNNNNSPGADDNASGISTITEAARVLFAMNFKPKRTIEFMAYAAEEVGLRGSREIAEDYRDRNVDVVSYVQFDMTNYKGSAQDVFISTDTYTNNTLNNFLMQLMDHYNATGTHAVTYGTSRCNYGCSDHYSWSQQGYDVSFPFEAKFSESNPNIHTSNDTFDRSPTPNATHAAKFVKLGLEFLIEVAKGTTTTGNVCATPSGLNANNVTTNSATISWNGVSNAQGYDFEYKKNTTNSWTLGTITGTSSTITGLDAGTNYDIRIRSNCQNSNSGYNTGTFSTQSTAPTCSNEINNYPYSQGFEGSIGNWEQATTDDLDWLIDSSGTPSNGTGPSSATEGTSYIYVEASGNGNGYPNKNAILTSPCFNLNGVSSPKFQFEYHMLGSAIGNLLVEVSNDNGSSWTTIFTKSGSQGSTWNTADIALDDYIGATIKIRFNTTTGASWQGDVVIDDVKLLDGTDNTDICQGINEYNSSSTYQAGDRVTYLGSLYERTTTGWTLIGACDATNKGELSINELKDDNEVLAFYPNPIGDNFVNVTVYNQLWKEGAIVMIDMKGNIQKEIKLNEETTRIEISDLASGIYFVTLSQKGKIYNKRLIKK